MAKYKLGEKCYYEGDIYIIIEIDDESHLHKDETGKVSEYHYVEYDLQKEDDPDCQEWGIAESELTPYDEDNDCGYDFKENAKYELSNGMVVIYDEMYDKLISDDGVMIKAENYNSNGIYRRK